MATWFSAWPLVFLSLAYVLQKTDAANILAIFPSVWKSHYLYGKRILEQLLAHNPQHKVTIISPYHSDANTTNMRELQINTLIQNWHEMGMSFEAEKMRAFNVMERFTRLIYVGTTNVDLLLEHEQVQQLLSNETHFDLLIVDLFLNDALLGIANFYDIPTIVLSPPGANSWLNHIMGNPQNSALDPSNFLPYIERMDTKQRIKNTLMTLFERLTYNFFHKISQQSVYYKNFEPLLKSTQPQRVLPTYHDLLQHVNLALINTHLALHYPRAYLPNIIEIGGAHLHTPEELVLPNHLQEFIETAANGTVYISFGANVRTMDLAREQLDIFLDVFAYLRDYHFLLKWESTKFEIDLPPNVMINSWFPQEAVLAHPHVKVFISSCGLLSVFEAIAGNTPILAIPLLAQQEVLAKRLLNHGASLSVNFDAITYDALIYGIRQLASNDSYQTQMRELQHMLQVGETTPISKTLYYIDLILKTDGGPFLKTHAVEYDFWRIELIDVLATIALGIVCILAIPFLVICCILRKSYIYSQEAAGQTNQNSNYHITLKSMATGGDNTKYANYDDDEYEDDDDADYRANYRAGEPLRRSHSAYSLTGSTSSSDMASTASVASLASNEFEPPQAAPPSRQMHHSN